MARKSTIGIVGQGFVGTAVNEGLAKFYYGVDLNENFTGIIKMLSCLMGFEK